MDKCLEPSGIGFRCALALVLVLHFGYIEGSELKSHTLQMLCILHAIDEISVKVKHRRRRLICAYACVCVPSHLGLDVG